MRVYNMTSNRSGRAVPNQFVIHDSATNRTTFQSYDSMIVTIDYRNLDIVIGQNYDCSATTAKYRNKFFSEEVYGKLSDLADKKTLEKAIKEGKFYDYSVRLA